MKEVITVRKNQKLAEVIRNLVFDEELFYIICIEKELVDLSELKKDTQNSHKLIQDGYEIKMDTTQEDWFVLWDFRNEERTIYSISNPFLYDYIYGHCGCKYIYIRKWGSKTEYIGEE